MIYKIFFYNVIVLISKEVGLLNLIFLNLLTLALGFFPLIDVSFVKYIGININVVVYNLVKNL